MCVASCSSLSLAVGLFLGPALTLQSTALASPSSPSYEPFNSCSAQLSSLSLLHFVLGLTGLFVTLEPLTVLAS